MRFIAIVGKRNLNPHMRLLKVGWDHLPASRQDGYAMSEEKISLNVRDIHSRIDLLIL